MVEPTMVYKFPGPHLIGREAFDYLLVDAAEGLETVLGDGWRLSPEDAKRYTNESDATREEMEEKASELGVKFSRRTSDQALMGRIEESIARSTV